MDIVTDETIYYLVVERTITTQYFTISAVVMFFCDWATQLDDEIELIWIRDWSLAGKPLYLFLRYIGFIFQVYDLISMLGVWDKKFCEIYYQTLAVGTALFLYLGDILLAYRVVCLYQQRFWQLLVVNITALLASITTTTAILCYARPLYHYIPTPEHLTGCWATVPKIVFLSMAPPILFEIWMLLLVLYKLYLFWRESHSVPKMAIMVNLLIRDQINWCFIITTVIIWNVLQSALAPRGLLGIGLPFFRSVVCICSCRLILHMRKAIFHPQGEVVTLNSTQDNFDRYAQRFGLPPSPICFWGLQTDEV